MKDTCNLLARLLDYPAADYGEIARQAAEAARPIEPETAEHLARFSQAIRDLRTEQLQELFIQTFDLNPACVLEVGWQLFGDDYKRGEFLLKMRAALRDHQLPESGELPDHLTHVLELLARMDPEEAAALANLFALPALEKMLASLNGKQSRFEDVLLAIRAWLTNHYVPSGQEVSHA